MLIAPAYALAGRGGVLAFQAALGGLLAMLTFKLAVLISRDEMASLLATLFVTLSPPLLMYQYLVYPELLGAFLTTLILYYAISQSRPMPTSVILVLFSLITLPWLNRRFIPLAIMLALLIAWAWRRGDRRHRALPIGGLRLRLSPKGWKVGRLAALLSRFLNVSTLMLFAATALSIGLLLWFNSQLTEVGSPDITPPSAASLLWERVTRGLVGWLVDQERGLLIYAPIYILALWGLPVLLSDSLRQRSYHWFVVLPFLLSLSVTVIAGGFWIAWELGPRFLVVALPALAPLLALAWRAYSRHIGWVALALLLFGLSLSNSLVIIIQNPELPYKSSLPLYYSEKSGFPLTEYLPDLAGYTKISPTAAADSTAAQVVSENGEMLWSAAPGSSLNIVRSGPLVELPFGHYDFNWLLRVDAGLPPETELLHISLKSAGGGYIFNKIITAANLPADGSYGEVQYTFLNPNVDRWRTPLVFNAVSTGQSHIWAKDVFFNPDPFYAAFLPYLVLTLLIAAALLAWYRCPNKLRPIPASPNPEPQAPYEQDGEASPNSILPQKSWQLGLVPQGVMWGLVLMLPITSFGYVFYQHQPGSRTYEASELDHFVGEVVVDPQASDGQGWLVDPRVDPPQKAVYGPFDIYEPGRYHITFRLKLPEAVETDQDLARLQVTATANFDELITQPLRLEHFSKSNLYHDFVLTVNNPRRQALSFEVYYLGVAPLLIDQVTITEVESSRVAE